MFSRKVHYFKKMDGYLFFSRSYTSTLHKKYSAIPVCSTEQLRKIWDSKITSFFSAHGFFLLQLENSEPQVLLQIAAILGQIQNNPNTDNQGITNVVGFDTGQKNTVVSSDSFSLHTDGAYLHGLAEINGEPVRVTPPKFVLLQCVKPSDEGGESILVDGKKALVSVLNQSPALLPSLFKPCVSMVHNDLLISDVSIFSRNREGTYAIRYSYDEEMILPKYSLPNISKFNSGLKPTFYQSLTSNQILVLDNKRMLHGRSAFKGDRTLRRVWIYDDTQNTELVRVQTDVKPYYSHKNYSNPLDLFKRYLPSSHIAQSLPLSVGINLPTETDQSIQLCLRVRNQK
ncbi:MAG: TauD/TfdA family dioxygenase [Proteobacteria bacterium]|nr:TauD/TfdA family dioxygenase [Pseudomonadota bacterium]